MSGASIWLNGAWTDRLDPLDRGFTLGDGVFDTLTALNRVPFAGTRHLERLTRQANEVGISVEATKIRDGWDAVLSRAEEAHVILRTTVTRGPAGRGLWPAAQPVPTIAVSATAWSRALLGNEVRLVTSAIARNAGSPSSRLKTLGYLDHVLAAREASEKGADDALFLNAASHVACTTIANVFAIAGGRLLTSPIKDGVMPGIMRALILEAAPSLGLEVEERSLALHELREADGVFLTNSVRFLSPVISLDGRKLSRRGAATESMLRDVVEASVREECGFDLSETR